MSTFEQIVSGKDEPGEMWMTGAAAIEFLTKLGNPVVDAHGEAIDPEGSYYLSKPTGLVRV